jgi:hypothetical protein
MHKTSPISQAKIHSLTHSTLRIDLMKVLYMWFRTGRIQEENSTSQPYKLQLINNEFKPPL